MSVTSTLGGDRKILLEERLQPTLRAAEREMINAEKTGKCTASAVERKQIATEVMRPVFRLGILAIFVSVLWTGQGMSDSVSLAIIALNMLVLLSHFYDHQVRKSGEPETSRSRAGSLERLILDAETCTRDYGRLVVDGPETEARAAEYERRFRYVMTLNLKLPEDSPGGDSGWARWKTVMGVVAGKGTTEKSAIV